MACAGPAVEDLESINVPPPLPSISLISTRTTPILPSPRCARFMSASGDFRAALAVSGGSTILVATFREWTWEFLFLVGAVPLFSDHLPWGMKPGLPVFTTSLNLCLV